MTVRDLVLFQAPECPICHQSSQLLLNADKVRRWQHGEHAQNVWPDMSPPEREVLISGTHPACWDVLFGSPEEED